MIESLLCRRHARRQDIVASSLVRKLALDKDGLEKRSLIDERGLRKLGERERWERVTQQVQTMSKRIGGFLVILPLLQEPCGADL